MNPLLNRLIPHLLLNFHFAPNEGLLNGKMGGVIFFGYYAQYTGKTYFREYAEELLDDIFDRVHENIPINFIDGLCGIGWGIEYLIQHSLMDGDADEVLEDIDKKIIERDPMYINDLSLYTGLQGILMYINARLSHFRTNNYQPFPDEYLQRVNKHITSILASTYVETSAEFNNIANYFTSRTNNKTAPDYSLEITNEFYGTLPSNFQNLHSSPIGIYQGLTGFAFKSILS